MMHKAEQLASLCDARVLLITVGGNRKGLVNIYKSHSLQCFTELLVGFRQIR